MAVPTGVDAGPDWVAHIHGQHEGDEGGRDNQCCTPKVAQCAAWNATMVAGSSVTVPTGEDLTEKHEVEQLHHLMAENQRTPVRARQHAAAGCDMSK